mgnify:CR=1 FL=1
MKYMLRAGLSGLKLSDAGLKQKSWLEYDVIDEHLFFLAVIKYGLSYEIVKDDDPINFLR